MLLFFGMGYVGFQTNQSLQAKSHFSQNNYTYLEGKIDEIQQRENNKYTRLIVSIEKGLTDWDATACSGKAVMYVDTTQLQDLKAGAFIFFPNEFERIKNQHNPGEFNATLYWNNLQIYHIAFLKGYEIQCVNKPSAPIGFFKSCQHYFSLELEKIMSGNELSIGKAILLGEKSDISTDIMNAFSGSGAMHLLSVSGLHIGIFVWILQQVLLLFYPSINRYLEITVLLAILWIYTGISGFSPSVNRAAVMFTFLLLARVSGKKYNSIRILLISAFILLLYNANYIFDIGFQLSYAAMIGIFAFYQPIVDSIKIKNYILLKCWETSAIGIAAQITTLPLTLYYFHQFPNYFLLTNIGLMVFSGVVLALGVAYLSVSVIPFISWGIGLTLSLSILFLVQFIQFIYELPYSVTTGIPFDFWEIPLFLMLLLALVFCLIKIKKTLFIVTISLVLFLLLAKNIQYLSINYFEKQFWVLNDSKPTLFFKSNGKGFLLIQSNAEDALQKSAFMKRNLITYFGNNMETLVLKKNSTLAFNNAHISIKTIRNGVDISGNLSAFYLSGKFITPEQLKRKILIIGNWVPYSLTEDIKSFREQLHLTTYILNEKGGIQLH
jgi:competence protein ComEC